MAKTAEQPEQYYKVVNTRKGHHGYFYHLGINTDPCPISLENVRSCGPGAFYFVTADRLSVWADRGDSIAWITPISKVKIDEDGDKFKSRKINVTKILPFSEALPLIREISPYEYARFDVDLKTKDVLKNTRWTAVQKLEYLDDRGTGTELAQFLVENKENKKLLKTALKMGIEFTAGSMEVLINAGVTGVIGEGSFRDLVFSRKKSLLKKFFQQNPSHFLELLVETY